MISHSYVSLPEGRINISFTSEPYGLDTTPLAGFRAGVMATIAINTVRLGRAGGQLGTQRRFQVHQEMIEKKVWA